MGDSDVCRWPVSIPALDVNQVMTKMPAFENKHIDNIATSKILQRLLAS
jgi:hypothetical protein